MASCNCTLHRFHRYKCTHCGILILLCLVSYFVVRRLYAPKLATYPDQIFPTKFPKIEKHGRGDLLSVSFKGENSSFTGNLGKLNKDAINIVVTLTKASDNTRLLYNFKQLVESIITYSSSIIVFHLICDIDSQQAANHILNKIPGNLSTSTLEVVFYSIDSIVAKSKSLVDDMKSYFSGRAGPYSDAFFLISIGLHRIFLHLDRAILLDVDLLFKADILNLQKIFNNFSQSQLIGVAREQQPTYRHMFQQYRDKNKGTHIGDPPPNGVTGYNSGVMLLDLQKLRKSELYNSLINLQTVKQLTEKYLFKGHLGDQDFYTLLSIEFGDLFYSLPCTWNRQLCQWWSNHGYKDVAESYHKCEGHINVYHGNCNTPFTNVN